MPIALSGGKEQLNYSLSNVLSLSARPHSSQADPELCVSRSEDTVHHKKPKIMTRIVPASQTRLSSLYRRVLHSSSAVDCLQPGVHLSEKKSGPSGLDLCLEANKLQARSESGISSPGPTILVSGVSRNSGVLPETDREVEGKLEGELGRPSTENRQSTPASFFIITSEPDRATGLQIPSSSSWACCLLKATCKNPTNDCPRLE